MLKSGGARKMDGAIPASTLRPISLMSTWWRTYVAARMAGAQEQLEQTLVPPNMGAGSLMTGLWHLLNLLVSSSMPQGDGLSSWILNMILATPVKHIPTTVATTRAVVFMDAKSWRSPTLNEFQLTTCRSWSLPWFWKGCGKRGGED